MDGKTLIVVLSLVVALTAAGLVLLHRLHPNLPGLRCWAIGCAVVAAGLYATAMRESFPLIAFGNWLIVSGHAMLLIGLRQYRGLPGRGVRLLLIATAATLPVLGMSDIDADSALRVVLHSGTLAAFTIAITVELLRLPGFTARLNATVFGLNGALHVFRAAWTLAHPKATDFLLHGQMTTMILLWSIFLSFVIAIAFTLMVTERLRDELARQANHDALTGILNRRGFDLVTDKLFSATARAEHPLSVLMMDLDHFKRINDTWGHAVGDRVLAHFARLANANLRDEDVFARMGGEEFVALLPNATARAAQQAAERLRTQLAAIPTQPEVTVSIGVASDAAGVTSVTDLMRRADAALYEAKAQGRDRVVVAAPTADALSA